MDISAKSPLTTLPTPFQQAVHGLSNAQQPSKVRGNRLSCGSGLVGYRIKVKTWRGPSTPPHRNKPSPPTPLVAGSDCSRTVPSSRPADRGCECQPERWTSARKFLGRLHPPVVWFAPPQEVSGPFPYRRGNAPPTPFPTIRRPHRDGRLCRPSPGGSVHKAR